VHDAKPFVLTLKFAKPRVNHKTHVAFGKARRSRSTTSCPGTRTSWRADIAIGGTRSKNGHMRSRSFCSEVKFMCGVDPLVLK
jgi:hypothetical protein